MCGYSRSLRACQCLSSSSLCKLLFALSPRPLFGATWRRTSTSIFHFPAQPLDINSGSMERGQARPRAHLLRRSVLPCRSARLFRRHRRCSLILALHTQVVRHLRLALPVRRDTVHLRLLCAHLQYHLARGPLRGTITTCSDVFKFRFVFVCWIVVLTRHCLHRSDFVFLNMSPHRSI